MWPGDALVDATVLEGTTRFLGQVVGALVVVALKKLALRFRLFFARLGPSALLA